MTDILAAEWAKVRTGRALRTVLGVLVIFTVLMLGIAASFVATWEGLPPDGRARSSMASLPELLGWVASLVMAVFGALAITTEFTTGMIRTAFLAMPARGRVLAAKALVVAAVSFVATEVALLVTLVGAAFIVGGRPITGQPPPDLGSLAIVVAHGLSATVFALLGLSLGTLTRSALASIVTLVLAWYAVPILAMRAPAPWDGWLLSVMPGGLAGQLAGSDAESVFGSALAPPLALLGMVAYAVLPLVLAAIVLRRRDA